MTSTRDLAGADVVVALKGGLGNQLFQWAFGEELVVRGARVRYDTGLFAAGVSLELGPLVDERRYVSLPTRTARLVRKLRLPARWSPWPLVTEPRFGYTDPVALDLRGRRLVEGYWQSPRYFERTETRVRELLLSWADAVLTNEGRDLLGVTRGDVWSVHVRRGDYLAAGTSGVHGVLDADWYRRAMAVARTRGARRFHVFTNDHAWVEAQLAGEDVVAVPWTVATKPIGEVGLMARCGGHIVANSSFSWWGAWLDDRRSPTLAPSDWFATAELDPRDLVPAAWERIPNRGGA